MAGSKHLVTYLSLTPEFGGTRFGPFEGLEVRLGTDKDRCHIALRGDLGILSEHVKIIRQGPLNLILAPAERTATVFLYKQGERRPSQVYTQTAVRPGDAFALVTPDGPRFVIEVDELPEHIQKEREARGGGFSMGGRKMPDGKAFQEEGKRQIWTTLLTTGPGQIAQRAYTYIISGAIFQPRNIIMMAMFLLAGGGIGLQQCRVNKLRRDVGTSTERVASCQNQLDEFVDLSKKSISEYTFSDLASTILGSAIGAGLREDKKLRDLVREKVKEMDPLAFEWVTSGQGSQAAQFGQWRRRLDPSTTGLNSDVYWLLLWAAAQEGRGRDEFRVLTDSTGANICGRGPLVLSHRQALRLGLQSQPDAYFQGRAEQLESDSVIEEHIRQNLNIPNYGMEEGGEFSNEILNSTQVCAYRTGEDDRNDLRNLARGLGRSLGDNARHLPAEEAAWFAVARLAKLYAADLPENDYLDRDSALVDFSGSLVSKALKDRGPGGDWVLEQTAEAIARAIMLPCYAALSGDPEKVKAMLGEEVELPGDLNCLILDYQLRNEM